MQTQMTKLIKTTTLVGFLALSLAQVEGGITMNWGAADLLKSDGTTPVPVGGLVILVADTGDNGFLLPAPGAFVSGDDVELARVAVGDGGYPAGQFLVSLTSLALGDKGNGNIWKVGDPLQMYWYPDLTTAASAPGAGAAYGAFRTDTVFFYSDAWVTPSDPSTVALQFVNVTRGGSSPDSFGVANLTVVPEPVNCALAAFGGIVLLAGVVRRCRFRGIARLARQ